MEAIHTNALANELSPYLLQHAHNPVNWLPWSPDVFERAKQEDKLVLISIGYSACHWCHVMEHESFEDEEVAEIMNQHFLCVKIDREEHPHIDSLYMTAVQLMNKQGGWPLNCFTLPDGRPIYGGTYFARNPWIDILKSLRDVYQNDRGKVLDYARRITEVIQQQDIIHTPEKPMVFHSGILDDLVASWKDTFDNEHGGPKRAPKFPLPTNYQFLLYFSFLRGEPEVHRHVHLTLDKMAKGGIYDQIGGGFARYSVDEIWKVPHFEKMLYDNAQLISLYSEAYRESLNPKYKDIIRDCCEFIRTELTHPNGQFYSALDADSDHAEGKYYVWKEEELNAVLNAEERNVIRAFYNVNKNGYWEYDQFILLRNKEAEDVATELDMDFDEFREVLNTAKHKLLIERGKRIKPGLDDKILLSWNSMMIRAYTEAARALQDKRYLNRAKMAITYIEQHFYREDGGLWHVHKEGQSRIMGLLEDYASLIDALLSMYQIEFEEKYLFKAYELCQYVINHFSDEDQVFFYFNHHEDEKLIARKKDLSDNVIPSSNSIMAVNLFILGNYFYKPEWIDRAGKMLQLVWEPAKAYLPGYSNWARLMLFVTEPFHEIALCGPEALNWSSKIQLSFIPNSIVAASIKPSKVPMLMGKHLGEHSLAYVCHNQFCERPYETFEELHDSIAMR